MTVNVVYVLGAFMAFLRRRTALDRVPVDDLWTVVELLDRVLRHLGIEAAEPTVSDGLLLSCIAATPNPVVRQLPHRTEGRPHHGQPRRRHGDRRRPVGRRA